VLAPKGVILDLLSAAPAGRFEVRELARAAKLFGIGENNLRVALTRLRAAGMVEATARGCYRLGPSARAVNEQVASWKQAEQRVREWDGAWIGVHAGGLPSKERRVVRRRKRALDLLGLRELRGGLFVRPDNLAGGLSSVRERLFVLGLDGAAPVFRISELQASAEERARGLWKAQALVQRYRELRTQLRDRGVALGKLALDDAAREAFVLGGAAIRQIVLDPLLPEPIVDRAQRRAFIDEAIRFCARGDAVWARFLGTSRSPADLHGIDRSGAIATAATARPGNHV
jgi:phenylacetic acid degradation operon negative regulatory protein